MPGSTLEEISTHQALLGAATCFGPVEAGSLLSGSRSDPSVSVGPVASWLGAVGLLSPLEATPSRLPLLKAPQRGASCWGSGSRPSVEADFCWSGSGLGLRGSRASSVEAASNQRARD